MLLGKRGVEPDYGLREGCGWVRPLDRFGSSAVTEVDPIPLGTIDACRFRKLSIFRDSSVFCRVSVR